jgi:hypothetical protein
MEIFKSVVLQAHCPLPLKKAFCFLVCSLVLRQSDNEAIENSEILQIASELLKNLSGESLATGKYIMNY